MPFLLLFIEIAILSTSRTHITDFTAPRALYDLLSLLLVSALFAMATACRQGAAGRLWDRMESLFARFFFVSWKKAVIIVLLLLAIALGLSPSLRLIHDSPIRSDGPDMLPLVREAGERILSFQSPFHGRYFRTAIPLTYFPAQILAYLPAVALRVDLRLFSLMYFILFLGVVYQFLSAAGRPLAAILSLLVLSSSGLIHFFLSFTQLFPYLFLLSLLFAAFLKERITLAAFVAGILLAYRQTFWFVFPLFVVLFIKKRYKLSGRVLACWLGGGLLGSLPYLLFPLDFFANLAVVAQHFSSLMSAPVFLRNSLGLTWYLHEHRWLLVFLQLTLLLVLYALAWRRLNRGNLWFYFSLLYLTQIFFISYNRPEEYYALPLLVAAAFLPGGTAPAPSQSDFPVFRALLVALLAFLYAAVAPGTIHPSARLSADSLWQQVQLPEGRKGKGVFEAAWPVDLQRRCHPPDSLQIIVDSPALDDCRSPRTLTVSVNEKCIHQETITRRFAKIRVPGSEVSRALCLGANLLEISLLPEVPYRLKVVVND